MSNDTLHTSAVTTVCRVPPLAGAFALHTVHSERIQAAKDIAAQRGCKVAFNHGEHGIGRVVFGAASELTAAMAAADLRDWLGQRFMFWGAL